VEAGREAELSGCAIAAELDEPVCDLGDDLCLAARHVLLRNGGGSEPEVLEIVGGSELHLRHTYTAYI
jgi:hypothetical protein